MSINSCEQFEKLRTCGTNVGKALRAMAVQVRAGVTTAEHCKIGSRVLADRGARSSPPMVYGFPGGVCISVDDEVVHGIPGDRKIQRGDLLKLDLTAEKDGYGFGSERRSDARKRQRAGTGALRGAGPAGAGSRASSGIARETLAAQWSAKRGGAGFMWCGNSAATASGARFTNRRRYPITRTAPRSTN